MNASYRLARAHGLHEMTAFICRSEIHPGNTVSFMSEVDLTEVEMLRARAGSRGAVRPTYTACVTRAVALALREFPYANRRLLPGWLPFRAMRLQQFAHCDVSVGCEWELSGVAVAACVHAIRDADRLSLGELTTSLRELATSDETDNEQWRSYKFVATRLPRWLGKLLIHLATIFPSLWVKYRGAAAMVSSPAKYGVDAVIGTWPVPLGVSFGEVRPRAVVRNGQVVARPTCMLTMNFDRRVMAGAQAARFFNRIVELLERAGTELAGREPAQSSAVARGVMAARE